MAGSSGRKYTIAEERRKLSERQDAVNEVHQIYSKFGSRVVQNVLIYASHPGGIRELVLKLPVKASAHTVAQAHDTIVRFIHECGVAAFLSLIAPTSAAPEAESAVAPPESAPAGAPLKRATADEEWIWEDRRSSKDRRTGKDRRAQVDLIKRNKRFGGDRRNKAPRRQNQVPPPWPRGKRTD